MLIGSKTYTLDSGEATYDTTDPTSVYGAVLYKKKNGENDNGWDGKTYTTEKANAVKETDYILKPYTQYSARYVKYENEPTKKIDVTINYTLDNYLNIEGTIGGVYYTKSGYLIEKGLVKSYDSIDFSSDTSNYSADSLKNEILGIKDKSDAKGSVKLVIDGSNFIEANFSNITTEGLEKFGYNDIKTIADAEEYLKKAYEKYENDITYKTDTYLKYIQDVEYEIQKYKAVAYYVSSEVFSNWVYENLGELQYKDIQDSNKMIGNQLTSGTKDFYYDFTGNTTKIFDDSEDPEATDSNFNTHRIEVIKNSIKYNLNQSISAYCNMKGSNDFSMPVLDDIEWDNILSRISIVSFMQGWNCGLDVYNNYQIAYSTNNELTVVPNEIYYVPKNYFNNGNNNYHRIDCPDLEVKYSDGSDVKEYIAFKSNDIKYDRLADKTGTYRYDHKNLACYTCINNNNYESRFFTKYNSENTSEYKADSYYDRINYIENNGTPGVNVNKKIAGYIGLGAMRQGTYKTNALEVSEGYEVKDVYTTIQNSYTSPDSIPSNVKQVQLTFSGGVIVGNSTYANKIDLKFNDNDSMIEKISLSTTETKTIDNPGTSIKIEVIQPDSGTAYVNLIGIKYIYK